MPPLWQRQAMNPANLETLWLLDAAFHLRFIAYRDTVLHEQLQAAWEWVFKTGAPSSSLALRSNDYVSRFGPGTGAPPGLEEAE